MSVNLRRSFREGKQNLKLVILLNNSLVLLAADLTTKTAVKREVRMHGTFDQKGFERSSWHVGWF